MSQPTNRVTRENCNGQPTYCDIELMQANKIKKMGEKSSLLSNYTEGGKIVLTFDFFQIITTKLDLIIDLSSFSDMGKTDNL